MKPVLEIHKLSKRFLIHRQKLPYLTFRDKLGELFRTRGNRETFWALEDVSFQVMRGEAVGIIGRNGAGKSTLLKVLSRITPPTKGKIVCRGRVASLLEVGTGFHQELTGRENMYMNASILGMRRHEVDARFDEIVDFSGVEKFLDTPLKFYSSGMQLRLAFAVAAHLEPEILIVDEILAVGDAEFQKKCLAKMADVSGDGRTILFVSHNLSSLKAICKKGVLLQAGKVVSTGSIDNVIDKYLSYQHDFKTILAGIHYFQPDIEIQKITINDNEGNVVIQETKELKIVVDIEFRKRTTFELDIHLKKDEQVVISYANFVNSDTHIYEAKLYRLEYTIMLPELRSGKYKIDLFFTEPFFSWFAVSENLIELDVVNPGHHTFLNSPTLKWGSVLAKGTLRKEIL